MINRLASTLGNQELSIPRPAYSLILAEALTLLNAHLDGKVKPYETIHPWRKQGRFVVLHTLRVEATALRLLDSELPDANDEEIFTLHLATRLHDIARLDAGKEHGEIGARLVQVWLEEQPYRSQALTDPGRILRMIASHSQKDGADEDLLSAILKDADLLDEIGALSIFLSGNHIERSSPDYYHLLLDRLEKFELPYCDQQFVRIHTRSGKQALEQRRAFIAGFIAQLRLEQEGTLDAGI